MKEFRSHFHPHVSDTRAMSEARPFVIDVSVISFVIVMPDVRLAGSVMFDVIVIPAVIVVVLGGHPSFFSFWSSLSASLIFWALLHDFSLLILRKKNLI